MIKMMEDDESQGSSTYREDSAMFKNLSHYIDKRPKEKQIRDKHQIISTKSCLIIAALLSISIILLITEEIRMSKFKKQAVSFHQKSNQLQDEAKKTKQQLQKYRKTVNQLKQQVTSLKRQQSKSNSIKVNQSIRNQNGIVIDIKYQDDKVGMLPLQFLKKNSEGKRIQEVLYDEGTRKSREQFQNTRNNFIKGQSRFGQLNLATHNNILNEEAQKLSLQQNRREWQKLQDKFKLSKIESQLPMCIVVPGYNNNANFRIQYNLNSIFSQNYTNYKVIIINDASTDGSNDIYRKYLSFYKIDKEHYTYIQNTKRVTALPNIYYASIDHCSQDSIVVTIDADDQFIGRNVLNVFNWGYQTKKAGVLYTNFYFYNQGSNVMFGFTSDYNDNEKKNNNFRNAPMKFSHLRSYRNQLIFQLNVTDLQDQQGKFYTITYDIVLFIPLMELSCGRVYKIEGQVHYLYNFATGINDSNDRARQVGVQQNARAKKKYECYKKFNDRMESKDTGT